jgi:thioredoxin 1
MAEQVMAVTDDSFPQEVLEADSPVVVDFWAEWCGPCRKVSPIIEELAGENEGQVKFAKMDVDQNPATPGKYAIMSIPTVILFNDGEVVDKLVGARSKSEYQSWIDSKT